MDRNFNTISPSARTLLLMKGLTDIPFAREAAELLVSPEPYIPDYNKPGVLFWARVLHFENRYKSIDRLLSDLAITNILEISSGYSFRGLEVASKRDCIYIDTDLPEVIETKRLLSEKLKDGVDLKGSLELRPLNVFHEEEFKKIISEFPPGEIVIVNEGLLMYLSMEEKERLCSFIHSVLKERGGWWITADIYIKKQMDEISRHLPEETREFFEQHNIEDNKFESFDEARKFFDTAGFEIDKEADLNYRELSTFKYFYENLSKSPEVASYKRSGKMQATWRLRVKDR